MQNTSSPSDERQDDSASTSTRGASQPALKQARIAAGFNVSQERANKLVFNFVVDDVQCFSVVEQHMFRKKNVEGISGDVRKQCVEKP